MKVSLVVKKGSKKAQVIDLRGRSTLLGRMKGCDVRIPSKSVSRHHCKLRIKYDYLLVEDLDSANGTFVNGERIEGKKVVRPNDLLQIGPVVFVVKYHLTDSGQENMGGGETVMKPIDIVEADDTDVEPVELDLADEEEADEHVDKDTSSAVPSLPAMQSAKKRKDEAKKKDAKKPPEKKPEPVDEDTPDASQILDDRHIEMQDGDLRSLFSDLEDK